jgi:hypothetical protein
VTPSLPQLSFDASLDPHLAAWRAFNPASSAGSFAEDRELLGLRRQTNKGSRETKVRRYYFDEIELGSRTSDETGTRCRNEGEALAVARHKARCHIRRSIRTGGLPLDAFIVIRRECGRRLSILPYSAAFEA